MYPEELNVNNRNSFLYLISWHLLKFDTNGQLSTRLTKETTSILTL